MKRLIPIFLYFSFVLNIYSSQDTSASDGEFTIIRSKAGVKVIYNSLGSSFSFDIKCSTFKQIESENLLFMVDDILIQFTPVPISYVFGKEIPDIRDSIALIYHLAMEMKNIRMKISGSYEIKNKLLSAESGRLLCSWYYDIPNVQNDTIPERVVRQVYATTRAGNRILMLSSAVARINDPEVVYKLIIGSLSSLVQFPMMIDIEKIREEILKDEDKQGLDNNH